MWTGISIGISINRFFSSALGIKSIRKKWYRSTFIVTSVQNFKKPGVHWPVAGACLVYMHYGMITSKIPAKVASICILLSGYVDV